jgi:hypothetical protein
MNSATEAHQYEQTGVACFSLNAVWLPLRLGDDVKAIINTVVQNLDTRYGKRAFACIRESEVEVHISNDYIEHIDTCRSACMAAFEALGYNKAGYVSACHENCRRTVRMAAFESLDNTCAKIEEELKRMGLKYRAEYDREKFPQYLKITVWL